MSPDSRRLLLDELPIASLLIYPSRPQSAADREAREAILTGIKQAKPRHLQRVAQRLADLSPDHPVRQLVPAHAVLVPAPRSVPLAKGSLWPALQIAEALKAAGVGTQVLPLLDRSEPVRRSTGARAGTDREPPLRHYETITPTALAQITLPAPGSHFVIVDDVVTTGSTVIACASPNRPRARGDRDRLCRGARRTRSDLHRGAGNALTPRAGHYVDPRRLTTVAGIVRRARGRQARQAGVEGPR